jgi:hypothetical protein
MRFFYAMFCEKRRKTQVAIRLLQIDISVVGTVLRANAT